MQLSYSQLQTIAAAQADDLKSCKRTIDAQKKMIKAQEETIHALQQLNEELKEQNELLQQLSLAHEALIKKIDPHYEEDVAALKAENDISVQS